MDHYPMPFNALIISAVVLFFAVLSPASGFAQDDDGGAPQTTGGAGCGESLICPGEDLIYEVSYLGIKLGRIRVKTYNTGNSEDGVRHRAAAFINSYNGIPFVAIHVIDSTTMDQNFYSKGFHSFEKDGDRWKEEHSLVELEHERVIIRRSFRSDLRSPAQNAPEVDTLRITDKAIQDGLSLFFFARANVRNQGEIKVPTVVLGKRGMTSFRFATERGAEEIDAVKDARIRVVRLEGTADFKGLYGMTGDFNGWFSDDTAAVPIKAQMGVFIGNVNIELVRWRRAGWKPPLVQENN